jgi:transposase
MSYLVGVQGVSKRSVEEILETAAGVPIALGTIANAEREVCAALAAPYQEARQAVADAEVKGVDETGWKEAGKKRWLWVAATMTAAVFLIHPRRSIEALKLLLGHLDGVFQSDRWGVYLEHLPSHRHQLCWAHLKRNWEKKAERSAKAKRLADRWFELHERVFALWHRFQNGEFDRERLIVTMNPHIATLTALYDEGSRSRDRVLARFCVRLLEAVERHWLFVLEEGVEPTNNQAERVQRRAVLWRRRSFGRRSAEGCRFVERLLTVVETLKLQKRNVLDYLEQAIAAHRHHQPCPQLRIVDG